MSCMDLPILSTATELTSSQSPSWMDKGERSALVRTGMVMRLGLVVICNHSTYLSPSPISNDPTQTHSPFEMSGGARMLFRSLCSLSGFPQLVLAFGISPP